MLIGQFCKAYYIHIYTGCGSPSNIGAWAAIKPPELILPSVFNVHWSEVRSDFFVTEAEASCWFRDVLSDRVSFLGAQILIGWKLSCGRREMLYRPVYSLLADLGLRPLVAAPAAAK